MVKFYSHLLQNFDADNGATAANNATEQPTNPDQNKQPENEPTKPENKNATDGNKKPSNERTFSRAELAKIVAEEREKAKAEGKTEAEKLASMNDAQKLEYKVQQLEAQNAELQKAQTQTAMAKEATKMLSAAGLEASDEVLSFVVRDTAEDTKSTVDAFVALVDKSAAAKTKAALSGKAPKVNTSNGATMTKDEIMKIKDPVKRQDAIAKNIKLFQ